jgi:MFS family permease
MILAALMDLIDTTIVNVALPSVARGLDASGTQLEWVVSAYLLGFAATLITAGRLGDLFGRKRCSSWVCSCLRSRACCAGPPKPPGS